MTKLTIAVMTYNRAGYFTEMIDSILSQTYSDFVVKIYDNGSTDGTEKSVLRYLGDPRVRYVKNAVNIGAGNNFNKAILECKTEYLLITHDDDTLKKDFIRRELEVLQRDEKIILVCTKTDLMDSGGQFVARNDTTAQAVDTKDIILKAREFFHYYISGKNLIACPTVMFRRKFLTESKLLFRTDIGKSGDTYFWFDLNMLDGVFYYINEPLYNYRIHGEQDSVNSIFMIPMLKKAIYLLLIKNNYTKKEIALWVKYINKYIWGELVQREYTVDTLKILSPCIFLDTFFDIFFKLPVFLYFYCHRFFIVANSISNIIRRVYRTLRKCK